MKSIARAFGACLMRAPRVGPILGYLRHESGEVIQRVFIVAENRFIDYPERCLFAHRKKGSKEWTVLPSVSYFLNTKIVLPEDNAVGVFHIQDIKLGVPSSIGSSVEVVAISLSPFIECPIFEAAGDVESYGASFLPSFLPSDHTLIGNSGAASFEESVGKINSTVVQEWIDCETDVTGFCPSIATINLSSISAADLASPVKGEWVVQFGSCRYPGTKFERNLVDAVIHEMANHALDNESEKSLVAANLILGDAIYADAAADVANASASSERWANTYIEAFTSEGFRRALATAPTYFIPDDHEFGNDWAAHPDLLKSFKGFVKGSASSYPTTKGTALKLNAKQQSFINAFDAFVVFECLSGPWQEHAVRKQWQSLNTSKLWASGSRKPGEAVLTINSNECVHTTDEAWGPTCRWKHLTIAGCPFFMMDTRTERTRGFSKDQICSDDQLLCLEEWLLQLKDTTQPVFIACGSPIAPAPASVCEDRFADGLSDAWWSYPEQYGKLMALVASRNAPKTIYFLGGDSHVGACGDLELEFKSTAEQYVARKTVHCAISSGLFAPLPGVNTKAKDLPKIGATVVFDPLCLTTTVGFKANAVMGELSTTLTITKIEERQHFAKLKISRGVNAVNVAVEYVV
jgi:hypothetical protein